MRWDVTAHPLFDGTFSTAAVASAAHALVAQLHDEAMATIAALADNWDQPVQDAPAEEVDELTYREPATWSVVEDEDDQYGEDGEDEVRVLQLTDLPPLLLRPRPAAGNVTARVEQPEPTTARELALAATDEFAVPTSSDRQLAAL
jgi:hypothetical protein